jgi:alpha-N-acetylglucosamine transferase
MNRIIGFKHQKVLHCRSPSFTGIDIPLPEHYVLRALPQLKPNHTSHPSRVPEDYWNRDTLNSGFMILRPSLEIFHCFESVLSDKENFDGSIAEQSVLNFVFSPGGPISWTSLDYSWNIQWPWSVDIQTGYTVLHEWWAPIHWPTRDYFLS